MKEPRQIVEKIRDYVEIWGRNMQTVMRCADADVVEIVRNHIPNQNF